MLVSVLAVAAAGGCGSSGNKLGGGGGVDAGNDGTSMDSGPTFPDGSLAALVISPANPTLNVPMPGTTMQFQALEGSAPANAQWTLDVAEIGTIDSTGLFTASGTVGGPTTVTAQVGMLKASTLLTVHLELSDNPGNVPPGTQMQLQAGAGADAAVDPAFQWLYPYDATVFARGIGAPELQVGGAGFDAAYLHISFSGLDYQGFYGASTPGRITLTPALWQTITLSAQAGDAVKVELTQISGGVVSGPISETWTVAQGNLRGTIYYNSYNSVIAGNTGAIMSLRPGQAAPNVVVAGCKVCHAVSADGSTMVSANEDPVSGDGPDTVWDLKTNASVVYNAPHRTWVFGALYPDGSKFLNYGAVGDVGNPDAPWAPNVRGVGETGNIPTVLYDPATGAVIPSTGLTAAPDMMMPTFSADGKMIAFTHYDKDQGHTIAVMDFDNATNTFSNLRDVATLPAASYVGWAAITPDDNFVFFAGGTHIEYSTISDDPGNTAYAANCVDPTGNLYLAHIPSMTNVAANELNGRTPAGTSYMPFADDVDLNFEPTILPEAVGGYFWVVFTSRRNYGNLVNGDPYIGAGGAPSPRKKLWVSAIDIQNPETPYTMAIDITHPAFYLEGQELASGNMRGFWALDPCEANGGSCLTGDECCSGFCRQTTGPDGGEIIACVPPSGCAQEGEKCTTAQDCCGAASGTQCIAGYCATPLAQ
jgi:hypothetical protein